MFLSKDIKNRYFTLLHRNIFVEGEEVPIFDSFAPDSQIEPYIILTVPSVVELAGSSCGDMHESIVQLDVVTKSNRPMGMNQAEDIAGQIDALVRPTGLEDVTLSSSMPIISKIGSKYVYRQLLNYTNTI